MSGVTCRVTCTWWLLWQAVYRNALVGTGWANSCLGFTNVVRKCYSHLVGASFLVVKGVWAQNGCLLAVNADYCKFANE